MVRKAERARLNPQDVGALSNETLFVSVDRAKQPKVLARAARQEKRKRPFSLDKSWSLITETLP